MAQKKEEKRRMEERRANYEKVYDIAFFNCKNIPKTKNGGHPLCEIIVRKRQSKQVVFRHVTNTRTRNPVFKKCTMQVRWKQIEGNGLSIEIRDAKSHEVLCSTVMHAHQISQRVRKLLLVKVPLSIQTGKKNSDGAAPIVTIGYSSTTN